jgi:hypothetical protein
MGVDLNNTSDKERDLTREGSAPVECSPPDHATRRKFTRNVVAGGAVLASLGNRAAWGVIGDPAPGCMSVGIFDSFTNTQFLSAAPGFDYELANNIIAVQNDTTNTQYPNLRVEYTDNQVCIVEVQGDAPTDPFADPLNKSLRQRDFLQ